MARIEREGTVIQGTLRSQDLILALLNELDDVKEEISLSPNDFDLETRSASEVVGAIDDRLAEIERRMSREDYDDSEEAEWDLQNLFDTLNSWAPEGMRFGAHEGDGADIGWWEASENPCGDSDEDEEE